MRISGPGLLNWRKEVLNMSITSIPTHHPIRQRRGIGLDAATVERQGLVEVHLSLRALPGESPLGLIRRLGVALRETEAIPVKQDVFGRVTAWRATLEATARVFGEITWPITYVEGSGHGSTPVGGVDVLALSGVAVEPIRANGRAVGSVFEDGTARHCLLGDIQPADAGASRPDQARQVFEAFEAVLAQARMQPTDLVRTWMFLDEILSWYGPFNEVRREYFAEKGLFQALVPASTGVGVRNPAGSALVAGAWAVQPTHPAAGRRELPSPLQCPAPSYGSCFSRAVELSGPDLRRVLVSGTASIEPDGRTVHVDDPVRQIELTMEVVRAILQSRELDFGDASRVIAYFKRLEDMPLFAAWCAAHDVVLPAVVTQAVICRDDLLFELELDAMAPPLKTP